jgi:probable phosphoglycerate mutase
MAATLLLVRHGETDWNRERRFQGHADRPLNDVGRAQAWSLAEELRTEPVAALYTSPLLRARQTAAILGLAFGLDPVADPRLMEIDVGSWTGLTMAEIDERWPVELERWRKHVTHGWSGGESYEALAGRVTVALVEIAARHDRGHVVVVGHGGTIRVALAWAARVPVAEHRRRVPPLQNCSVHRLVLEAEPAAVD